MTNYREILRLSALGFSQQNIAYSCNVSKKTVNRIEYSVLRVPLIRDRIPSVAQSVPLTY